MLKARGFWMCNLALPPPPKIFLLHCMEELVLHSILFAILCENPFKSSVTVQVFSPLPKQICNFLQREHRFMGKNSLKNCFI
jgi:hypothetical protein